MPVEPAFGQRLDLGGGGPDEVAADARFRHAEALTCHVDNLFIITSAHATDHAAEHGSGHGVGGLESRVGLQRDLAAAVGPPHAGTVDRQLLPGQGRDAPLVAIPRVRAVGLVLVPRPAQPGHLVLQEARGDQQAQLDGQTLQGVLHQGQQLVPIQGELDLAAGVLVLGSTLGRLSACVGPLGSHRLVSRRFLLHQG